jgi:lipoyl(octanoyl) transferase
MCARLASRIAGDVADALLLVEHDEVITVGRRPGAAANLVAPGDVPVVEVERGGDVTYHGPGQLVGYPVVALAPGERDVGRYLRALEDALGAALAELGVKGAGRRAGLTGVWVGGAERPRKIASIGIAVRRWVTWHGFALNVTTDLARFHTIQPCGLTASVMTSVAAEGGDARLDAARAAVHVALAAALGRRPVDPARPAAGPGA